MIKIFEATEKMFNHNGIKILNPIKCIVYKEDNGDYYLDIEDIIDNVDYYQANMIITCPTPFPEGVQAFRIIKPIKNLSKISVRAQHIYFDSANYVIDDRNIVDKNCGYALNHLNSNTDNESPFTTNSNISSNNSYRCVRKSLENAIYDIIERWGGHLVRDNFNISINSTIGSDRGVVLKYAKNIINIKAEENWSNVITKILPVGSDGLLLPEKYIELEESLYDIPFTKVVSFSQDLNSEDYETEEVYKNALIEDLRSQATSFLNENKIPKVNYNLSAHLDNITDIGDVIYVEHPNLNISLNTNVISVKWDAISKKYKNIEFGNFKKSLKNLIKEVSTVSRTVAMDVSQETKVILQEELKKATSEIWNQLGNSYVIYEGDKILVVDTLPKEDATNVMMINSGGIGFSTTGINGTFNSAWTIDGVMDMQNINVINLVADMIQGGTLKLGGENNINGSVEIYDANGLLIAKLDKEGIQFNAFTELSISNKNLEKVVGTQATTLDELATNQKNIDEKQAQTELDISSVKGTIETLSGKVSGLRYNVATNSLEIADYNSRINSTIDNTGLKVYNYDKLNSIFTDKGTGIDKLIVTGTAQIGYLKFGKATTGLRKNKKCTQIFVLDNLVENLEDLESE